LFQCEYLDAINFSKLSDSRGIVSELYRDFLFYRQT